MSAVASFAVVWTRLAALPVLGGSRNYGEERSCRSRRALSLRATSKTEVLGGVARWARTGSGHQRCFRSARVAAAPRP
jgi:hypothetical protein